MYFKELGAGKSGICRTGPQAGILSLCFSIECELLSRLESQAGVLCCHLEENPFFRKSPSLL